GTQRTDRRMLMSESSLMTYVAEGNMDVFEAVRTVLAVRTYADRAVPDDAVRRIVEAGRLSASAGNQQPWHFIVISEPTTIRKIGEIMTTGPYASGASRVIAVMIVKDKRI